MDEDRKNPVTEPGDRSCDVKSWCPSCERGEYITQGDKYLCSSCGKIASLDHEMHHEHFPHLSGDKDTLY